MFLANKISPNLGKFPKVGVIFSETEISPKIGGIPQICMDLDSMWILNHFEWGGRVEDIIWGEEGSTLIWK